MVEFLRVCGIHTDATPVHFKEDRREFALKFVDFPEIFGMEGYLLLLPDGKGLGGVGFAVRTDEVRRQFPEVFFWIEAPVLCSFTQESFVLAGTQPPLGQRFQRIPVRSFLVEKGVGNADVIDPPTHFQAQGAKPTKVVLSVGKDVIAIRAGELLS
jgi:hypothetical protein